MLFKCVKCSYDSIRPMDDNGLCGECSSKAEMELGQETAPENLYYEISVAMVEFIASLYHEKAAVNFMDDNCEPLFEGFEKVISEIKERCPDLYMKIRTE